jgi:hypothetical protein
MYNPQKTQPLIAEQFSGIIWKIRLSATSNLVAVETRDTEHKKVTFSVLDIQNSRVLIKEKAYEESWNLNLAFIGEKNMILNGYEYSGSPESKGLLSVDIRDGSILWQRFNIALNQADDRGVEVFDPRMQPRKYQWINHLNAEVLLSPSDPPAADTILFPEPDHSYTLPSFISHGEIIHEILHLDYAGKHFISFHEKIQNHIQQRVVVYQADKILIDDILISGIQKLQPEAFLIHRNHLLYIRKKQEIISYLV